VSGHGSLRHKADFAPRAKSKQKPSLMPVPLGQCCPQACPPPGDPKDPLGEPLSLRETAALIGCSEWTIREKYIPAGLPHFRLGRTGKLTFYRKQVINWLIARQRKGGFQ